MDQSVSEVIKRSEEVLLDVGLTEAYIEKLKTIWGQLGDYVGDTERPYGPDVGRSFLLDRFGICLARSMPKQGSYDKIRCRAIRILDNTMEYGEYVIFDNHGFDTHFAPQFEKVFTDCIVELKTRLVDATILMYVTTLNRLSAFLDAQGIQELSDLSGSHVIEFMESVAQKRQQPTIYGCASRLRRVLAYLHRIGETSEDLSFAVPKAKVPEKKLPTTYSEEEVEAMLEANDIDSAIGKRNRAICLLAARLGIRASDICNMKFENLRWASNTIEFTTVKTRRPCSLPLTNEIGEAVIAYLDGARPESGEPYVFLRHQRPYTKMKKSALHAIVEGSMRRAGIKANNRRRGPHALRSSLASRMLAAGTPLPVISEALAHDNSDTTRIYLKVDLGQLRRCSLEVRAVSGVWGWGD